jgi:hypothetical protein
MDIGYFYLFALVNNTFINVGIQISVKEPAFPVAEWLKW